LRNLSIRAIVTTTLACFALLIGIVAALGYTGTDLANQALAVLGECNDRWDGPAALGAGDDGRLAALHDCDDAVGRAKVDADDPAHV